MWLPCIPIMSCSGVLVQYRTSVCSRAGVARKQTVLLRHPDTGREAQTAGTTPAIVFVLYRPGGEWVL